MSDHRKIRDRLKAEYMKALEQGIDQAIDRAVEESITGVSLRNIHTVSLAASESLENVSLKQDLYGFDKYHKALDPLDPKYDWLKMAREELADLNKYLYCEEVKRNNIVEDVRQLLETLVEEDSEGAREEIAKKIIRRLNELKGTGEGVGDHKPEL